jgi:hypothetical protein
MPPRSPRRATGRAGAFAVDGRTAGVAALALVIVAAAVVLSGPLGGSPAESPGASALPESSASPESSAPPGTSEPGPSDSPASAVLEALLPDQLDGTTLTVDSATGATSVDGGPTGRALDAAVVSLGKQPADLEIAIAYDDSGAVDLTILAFRIAGIDAATLERLILQTWIGSTVPGVTTTQIALAGSPVTQVSYGDGGPDEYVFVYRDAVVVIETGEPTLAGDAVGAITAATAAPGSSEAAAP